MVRVINNTIVEEFLPPAGVLADGKTVSNYDLLPIDILLKEGWLPLEVVMPQFDEETQYVVHDRYEILHDKVLEYYKIEEIVFKEAATL